MRPIPPRGMPGWEPVHIDAGPGHAAIDVAFTSKEGGYIMTEWEFTAVERAAILAGANLLVRFKGRMMPQVGVAVDGIDE